MGWVDQLIAIDENNIPLLKSNAVLWTSGKETGKSEERPNLPKPRVDEPLVRREFDGEKLTGNMWSGYVNFPNKSIRKIRHWVPDTSLSCEERESCAVIFVHDYGSHSNRSSIHYFAKYLTDQGIDVLCYDQKFHGQNSNNKKGKITELNTTRIFVAELDEFISMFIDKYKDKKYFLIGEGFGSLICLNLLENAKDPMKNFCGFISLSLPLEYKHLRQYSKKAQNNKMVFMFGKFFVPSKLVKFRSLKYITQVEKEREEILSDDLCFMTEMSVKFFYLYLLKNELKVNIPDDKNDSQKYSVSFPLLFLQGENDKLINLKKNRNFFNLIESPDKEIKEYSNMLHELLSDENRDLVLSDICSWIDKTFKSSLKPEV
eukprot:snap_masked-scaffold_58-processed-gene-0.66-mRNA-1 protein AED:1.00 eAED:1.00 QI:0/-1/0/0/-1/1/1/0/373